MKEKSFKEKTISVKTTDGILEGICGETIMSFLGIPYAKAPVGALRWKEPQELEPWEGTRTAYTFGSPALQAPSQSVPGGDPADRGLYGNTNEDCLFLNVWTPDTEGDFPVFVWIHGGAFCCGSGGGNNASPEPFCKRGIVYVTFNYRVGLMGYYAHPELSEESEHGVSGNYAHFDQIAALKWVQKNIQAFGGDPNRVTIGGCSAGAGSVQALCCSPLAEGLFHRAIIESSVRFAAAEYAEDDKLETLAEMESRGVEYMKRVGCESVEQMRKLSYEQLIDFDECHFRRKYHYGTTMGMNQDGYLLPVHPKHAMPAGKCKDIPYIVGNTHDEGGGFIARFSMDTFEKRSKEIFGETFDEYMTLCAAQTKEEAISATRNTHLVLAAAKVFAERSADWGRKPVYVFDFCRKDPRTGIAQHGFEIQYLFGIHSRIANMTEEDDRLAESMQNYWCNFIKFGDPNDGINSDDLPEWTPYSSENRKVLYLDSPCSVEDDSAREHPLMTFARKHLTSK